MKEILKVPLFILPNVVFFPSTSLPLYIADQKYESLIQSAIQHGQFVGVSLQKDDSYFEGFQGHEIFGVGRPIIVERIPNKEFLNHPWKDVESLLVLSDITISLME